MTDCACTICTSRMARDEPPLPGISVMTQCHVTADEMSPPPRRAQKQPQLPPGRFVAVSEARRIAAAEIKRFADNVLTRVVAEVMREAEARSMGLELQIKALRRVMEEFRFAGPWQEGKTYKAGNICSLGGAIYNCNTDTTSRPGFPFSDWQLLVPKPRDGRDGRDAPQPEPSEQRMVRSRR